VKKILDMALGGWVSVFGVKFLNRIDIRSCHECYPLDESSKFCDYFFSDESSDEDELSS